MPPPGQQLLTHLDMTLLSPLERAEAELLQARSPSPWGAGPRHRRCWRAAAKLELLDGDLSRALISRRSEPAGSPHTCQPARPCPKLARLAGAAPQGGAGTRAPDTLLDGLVARYATGFAAGAPTLKRAVSQFTSGSDLSSAKQVRWLWYACTTCLDLWDDQGGDLLSRRFVGLARDTGTMPPLPLALTIRSIVQTGLGDLAAADGSLQELNAVTQATGVSELPYAAQFLAVWRGRDHEATQLLAATTQEARRRGEGIGLQAVGWMQALHHNSHGRYQQALTAALEATSHQQELGVVTWSALVELVTAASRTGQQAHAEEAMERLREMTQASGSEWALGHEARCRALVLGVGQAEDSYVEAVERLANTGVRGELARAQLHYGEWLRATWPIWRRQKPAARRAPWGSRTWKRGVSPRWPPPSSAQPGECPPASGRRLGPADLPGGADRPARQRWAVQCRDRGPLVHQPPYRRMALSKIFAKLGVTSRRQLRR